MRWIEHLGDQNHLHLALGENGEHDFVTLTDPGAGLSLNDAVDVDFLRPLYFDRAGQRIGNA